MDRLPNAPTTFREIVEADLRRAARLIVKHQAELDPQFRIGTPKGDWHIAISFPADEAGRREVFKAVATFMAWKQAAFFTIATELLTPDAVWCGGIAAHERWASMARITRSPEPWTANNFGPVEWLSESNIDAVLLDLLPTSPQPFTPKDYQAMLAWFGKSGRFPAINLSTGAVGA